MAISVVRDGVAAGDDWKTLRKNIEDFKVHQLDVLSSKKKKQEILREFGGQVRKAHKFAEQIQVPKWEKKLIKKGKSSSCSEFQRFQAAQKLLAPVSEYLAELQVEIDAAA